MAEDNERARQTLLIRDVVFQSFNARSLNCDDIIKQVRQGAEERLADTEVFNKIVHELEARRLDGARNRIRVALLNIGGTAKFDEENVVQPLLFLAALTCPRDQRDALVGDFKERYSTDCERWGTRGAVTLLVRDIAVGLLPAIGELFRKAYRGVLKALGLSYFMKHFWN